MGDESSNPDGKGDEARDPSPPAGTSPEPLRVIAVGFCPACGYDLRGLRWEGKCPECGVAYTGETVVLRPQGISGSPWRFYWPIVLYFAILIFASFTDGPFDVDSRAFRLVEMGILAVPAIALVNVIVQLVFIVRTAHRRQFQGTIFTGWLLLRVGFVIVLPIVLAPFVYFGACVVAG